MTDAEQRPVEHAGKEQGRLGQILVQWLRDLLLAIFIATVLILFVYQPVKVEGTSMLPSLEDQERIFINKFTYRLGFGRISRGDLVVFHFPGDPGKSYIKRVVGLPGDTVEIREGVVFVNSAPLDEEYVPESLRDSHSWPLTTVPEDHYYVLGDHRASSNDSRHWGPLRRSHIYGRAAFVYWPPDKIGSL